MNSSSSSSTKDDEAKGEAIVICLDSGMWMESTKSPMFKEQEAAVLYYCEQKFKHNSRTVIGLCGSSESMKGYNRLPPTKDFNKIKSAINKIMIRGHIRIGKAADSAYTLLSIHCKDMQKRIAFFAGGPLYSPIAVARSVGEVMKERNVASDAITFGDPYMSKRLYFDTFICFADNDGNCNICHVPPESSPRHALYTSSQFFIPRVGGGGGSGLGQSSGFSSLPQHDKNKAIVVYVRAPSSDVEDRRTDCPFCQTVLLTLEEKNLLYDKEFIDLHKKPEWFLKVNPPGKLPLIKFSDGRYVSNSEVILEMIEEMYPDPPLLAPPYIACLGLKIIPRITEYLKTKDKRNDQGLLCEFRKLDAHLENHCGQVPFVDGVAITTVDLSLAPKLYHLIHACKLTIPEDLPYLQRYTQMLFDRPSFRNTKPSIEDVVEGWRKRLRITKDKMP